MNSMRIREGIGTGFWVAALCGILFVVVDPGMIFAQSGDGEPPRISNIIVTTPTATSAVVTWETDEDADSLVNYGLNKEYGIARDPSPNKRKHSVLLDDLEPSTVYHLRVGSSDIYGNQGISGDYQVITKGTVYIKDAETLPKEERARVERAVQAVQEIRTPEGLKIVAEAVGDVAKKILTAPVIIGKPNIEELGADYAIITWATDQDANSIVEFATEREYRPGTEKPYAVSQGNFEERTKEHRVRVVGFQPGTLYHFRAVSEGELGLTGLSRDMTLTTKALIPSVLSFRVVKVEEDSATLQWRTSVPAAGAVEYTDVKTKEVKTAGSPVFSSTHTVKIAGLRLGAKYSAVVRAENAVGEKSTSNAITFTTVKDTAPPLISKVSNESTLYPSAEAKVQTIVTWATDEAAFCQFYFREGLAPNVEPTGLGEEKEPRTNHVQVVVEFLPSTVYQFWVECKDRANNRTKSENFVLFTPNKEKSIIDIILENFEGAFGWVKNIGK